jgi:membrane-bound lytic murein transglycosylase F
MDEERVFKTMRGIFAVRHESGQRDRHNSGSLSTRMPRLRRAHIVFASTLAFLSAAIFLAASGPGRARVADFHALGELRVATRIDALAYREDENGTYAGFEHDLLVEFGRRLGVPVRFVPYPDTAHALAAVIDGQAHLAAAGLTRDSRLPVAWTAGLREIDFVLVGSASRRGIARERDLAGRIVTVRRGTPLASAIAQIRQRVPEMEVVHPPSDIDDQTLLTQLAAGQIDLLAVDRVHYALASRFSPKLAIAYELPLKSSVAWALPLEAKDGLARAVNDFLGDAGDNGFLTRVEDRYFGHVRRLDRYDIAAFLKRAQKRLPRYLPYFREAETRTGIDWRYLAALAYQESQWNPEATSYTGVRGMMMLTVETANRLGVDDRLDPRQAILGGARYIAMLQKELSSDVPDPDRMWMATAAYNIGMGSLINARALARMLGRNDSSWAELKSVLPLLSRRQYADRLKSRVARGGEALIMTENIRNFYDILRRTYPIERPLLVESMQEPASQGLQIHARTPSGERAAARASHPSGLNVSTPPM